SSVRSLTALLCSTLCSCRAQMTSPGLEWHPIPPPRVGTERQDIELATVSQELFGKASAEWAVESSLLAYLDVLCFGRHGNETQMQYFVPPVSGRPRFSRATLEVQHDEQPAGLPPVLLR